MLKRKTPLKAKNPWQRKPPKPKKPTSKNSRTQSRYEKEKVRAEVIERDGDWCLLCGKPPKGLQLHRIIYGSQGGKYERTNCVQLCINDHNPVVHANKRKWQPVLLEYIRLAEVLGDREWVDEFRRKFGSTP